MHLSLLTSRHGFPKGWNNRLFLNVNRKAGSKDAFIEFWSGGLCKRDGSDILIIDAYGKSVPREITSVGPGDRFLVTFQLTSADKYVLYYNNPNLIQLPAQYSRQSGLLLSVFELEGNDCRDVQQLETIVEKSRQLIGSGYRKRIFDGFNPYGDSDNFLAVYAGWIDVPNDGIYHFATNSDDTSFLFIDGKLIVSFPGKHAAWAMQGQRNGKISLTKGIHQIMYYHIEFIGPQIAVAGWKKPGEISYEVIPEGVFVPISMGQIARREAKGKEFYDFTFSYGEVLYSGKRYSNPIIEVRFQPYIANQKSVKSLYWDFGNGQFAREKSPSRLFLRDGLCTVKMSVLDSKNISHSITHIVPVFPIEMNNARLPESTSQRFARILAMYNPAEFDREDLLTLLNYYISRSDDMMVAAIGTRLMILIPDTEKDFKLRFLRQFSEYLNQRLITTAALREKAYDNMIILYGKGKEAQQAYLGLANACYEQGKIDKALESYRSIADSSEKWRKQQALVGLGYIMLEKNKSDEALKYFREASKISTTNDKSFVYTEFNAYAVDNLTAKGDWQEALVLLKEWEIRNPMSCLEGETLILRVKAFQKAGDVINSIRYAKVLADNLGQNPYTPEAYAVLIALLKQAGRPDEANVYYERLKDEYPDSRFFKSLEMNKNSITGSRTGKDN